MMAHHWPVCSAYCEDNLSFLRRTERSYDVIYADPPYNTGGLARYKNSYDDWSSFIAPRVVAARERLQPYGLLLVSISDENHYKLKSVLDEAFGSRSYVATIVWDKRGGVRHKQAGMASTVEWVLVYVRERGALRRIEKPKPHVYEALAQAEQCLAQCDSLEQAEHCYRAWHKTVDSRSLKKYVWLDARGPHARGCLTSEYSTYRYPIYGPHGRCKQGERGWTYPRATMERLIAEGRISFRAGTIPRKKLYLAEHKTHLMGNLISVPAQQGGRELRELGLSFPYPKPVRFMTELLSFTHPNSHIMDMFAGSGTTAVAVQRLNQRDGGRRKVDTVNSHEAGIYEDVLIPRLVAELGPHSAD